MSDNNDVKKVDDLKEYIEEMKIKELQKQLEQTDLSFHQKARILAQAEGSFTFDYKPCHFECIETPLTSKSSIEVNIDSFSVNAFENVPIDILKEILKDQDTILERIALKKVDFDVSVTDEKVSEVTKQINSLIAELWENHYSNLYLAFVFYAILQELSELTGIIKFIQMKNSVFDIMLQYNSEFSLNAERRGMYSIYNITAIIDEFKNYVSSPEYLQELNAAKAQANVNSVNLAEQSNPYTGYFNAFSSKKNKDAVSVNVVRISDIEIDPNNQQTLSQKLQTIKSYFDIIRNDSEAIFTTIQVDLEYNISTGQVSGESTNERMLDLIGNTKYLKHYFNKAKNYRAKPRIFLVDKFKLYSFTAKEPIPMKTLGSYTLKPGGTESIVIKTAEKTQKRRSETSSIFDSNSTDAQKDFSNECENEREMKSSRADELNMYFDAQAYAHAETTVNAKIFGKGADVDASAGIDTQGGIAKNIQTERTESAKMINRAARRHLMNAKSKRDTTFSEGAESITEEEKQQVKQSDFRNPNKNATVDILDKSVMDITTYFVVHDGAEIVFSNTITFESRAIRQIDAFLREYIGSASARKNIKNEILEASKVEDYQGRLLPYLDENFNKIRKNYFTMLKESGYTVNGRDLAFSEYFDYIFGIPIVQDNLFVERPGSISMPISSNSCLSELEFKAAQVAIAGEEGSVNFEKAKTEAITTDTDLKRRYYEDIVKSLPAEKAVHAFFMGLTKTDAIFNKAQLLKLVGDSFKDTEL